MGLPANLRPDEAAVFVTRELRKAGLEVSDVRVRSTERAKKGDDWIVEMTAGIETGEGPRVALIVCRRDTGPVAAPAVDALAKRRGAPGPTIALMFATAGFDPDALRVARELGIPTLVVADGKDAFLRGGWGMAGTPPSWVPEYVAVLVELDAAGEPHHEMLVSGVGRRILERASP